MEIFGFSTKDYRCYRVRPATVGKDIDVWLSINGELLHGMWFEGVHCYIYRALRQCWLENDEASLEDMAQKTMRSLDLQRNETKRDSAADLIGSVNHRARVKSKTTTLQNRQRQVMNFEQEASLSRSPITRRVPPSEISRSPYATAMFVSDEMAAVESGKFDLVNNTSMDLAPLCPGISEW